MDSKTEYTEDEVYVGKAQNCDPDALAFLLKKYHNLAHYIALKICHCDADAEDIVQESFIEVEKSICNLKEPRYFKAWLNKIIFSKSTKLFRKRKDIVMSTQDSLKLSQFKEERRYLLPKEETHFKSDQELLLHMIDTLPEKLRIALYLMYFEQLSVREISLILDIPEGTVKSRINAAKGQLKEKIEQYEAREQVRMDFHAISLDALLVSVFASEWNMVEGVALSSQIFSHGAKLLKAVPPTTLALITFCVVSTGVLGYAGYHAFQNHPAQTQPPIQQTLKSPAKASYAFEPVIFQGKTLTTAEEAHRAIVEVAHCYEEIKELDAQTQAEIKAVYQALKKSGGAYYELLYNRNYAEEFE